MSNTLRGNERKELHQTNVGLQLLFDNTQARTSAIIFLQWCVAKPIVDYLREKGVQSPLLFVQIFNPKGREARYLFDLSHLQEVIQFYSPGKHTIKATLVWGARPRVMRSRLLSQYSNGKYEHSLASCYGTEGGIGLKQFGSAELSVEVPAEFFAPQLSAQESWWVNLFFQSTAKDSCSIRRRRMFAYTVQVPIVGTWVALKVLWRLAIALFASVLLACRVDWGAIFRPFTQDYKDVWFDNPNNYSWIAWKANGETRWWGEVSLLLTPLIHLILGVISLIVVDVNEWEWTVWNFLLAYAAVIGFIVAVVAGLGGVVAVGHNLSNWWEVLSARLKPDQFDQLLCATAPAQGLRPVGYTPRLLYQRVKAAYCKPVTS